MKRSQRVVCISREFYLDDNRNIIKGEYEPNLTLGKVYELIEYPPNSHRTKTIFNFLDDSGEERSYKSFTEEANCFITLEKWISDKRVKRLKELGI